MIDSYLNVTVNSVVPALCLVFVKGYAAYFALKQQVRTMFLGSFIFGLGALYQMREVTTWYETGTVPSPAWIFGDSVETAVYLLAVVLFFCSRCTTVGPNRY